MKATAKTATNLKPMAGGGAIATLPVGGWIYGDKGATDIINFTHWYRPTGQKMELGAPCKAFIGTNLVLSDEAEPGTQPDPPPTTPPTTDTFPPYIPIGSEWKMRFKVNGEYTDYFTFVRID